MDDENDFVRGEVTNPSMLGVCAKLFNHPRVAPFKEGSVEWYEWLDAYDGAEIFTFELGNADDILGGREVLQ